MKLIKLYNYECNHEDWSLYCLKCKGDFKTYYSECSSMFVYCKNCGEEIAIPDAVIRLGEDDFDKNGALPTLIAILEIEGEMYAFAYINRKESSSEVGVAHLWLDFIPKSKQTDLTAKVISDFAKWIRSEWENHEAGSLETLVRLMGKRHNSRNAWPNRIEEYIVLEDATKITKEHLPYKATLGGAAKGGII